MTPIVLDPAHPAFPPEPKDSPAALSARRAAYTRWLWARLHELEGDCQIRSVQPELGQLDAAFPAQQGGLLVPRLAEAGVFCTVDPQGDGLRFTLSAGQRPEAIDTLQAVLMELLDLS